MTLRIRAVELTAMLLGTFVIGLYVGMQLCEIAYGH